MMDQTPTISEESIYNIYIQGRASAALAVAVHLNIFDILAAQEQSAQALSKRLGLQQRGIVAILRSLSAVGLLHFETASQKYSCSESSKIYLCKDQPTYIGALIDMEVEHFLTPQHILTSLQNDKPSVYEEKDVWENHQIDLEQARRFTAAMHSISTRPAMALAEQDFWSSVKCVLDVGAGSGVLSIALLQKHMQLHAILMDIPSVCSIAEEYIVRYGVSERVQFLPLDMFHSSYPKGCDAILFSQILHDWNFEQGKILLQKSYDALDVGGKVIIHEKLTDPENNHQPVENALVNLDMLIWTQGQQYSFYDLQHMLEDIGFVHIQQKRTHTYWSYIIGEKPS